MSDLAGTAAPAPEMDGLIGALLHSSGEHVLETMFFTPIFDVADASAAIGFPRVVSRLHFHGKPSGDFEVDADPEVARSLTAGFLAIDEGAVTPAQEDQVLAEFCNMTCGSALSSLGCVEYFSLQAPATSRTHEFAPAVEGVRRAFLLAGGTLSVCLRIAFEESRSAK
jgi:hypothetical protein